MEKLICAVILLGWSGMAAAQQAPARPADRVYSRDDPYITCAKKHPNDLERFSHCNLKGEWHAEEQAN